MAGAGYKLFNTGDVLTAAQVNTYLQQQVTMVFANSTARTTALSGVLAEGMMSYLQDTNTVEVYDGSNWVSVGNTGDITGVTAGTGLTGGGTSGTVTLTNDMATTITAKGDLLVGTGNATYDNLAVGTNGYTLVADSSETTGLKWQAPAAAGFVGCSLYASANISVDNDSSPILTWDSERFDTDAFHSTSSNTSRITIPSGKGGKYLFMATGAYAANANGYRAFSIFKNGANYLYLDQIADLSATIAPFIHGATILEAVAGDYFELGTNQTSGGSLNFLGSITYNEFSCVYLGA